ncbi:MAG: hypothetical protein JNM48_09130 [Rhodospirillales bacterium]|nr:hypothetical protein [Rhodospirillales bacterium]
MSLATTTTEEAANAIKDAARQVDDQFRASSAHAYEQARAKAERVAVDRRDDMASYARDLADALDDASTTLQERGRDTAARVTRRAAEEIDAIGSRVEGQNISDLLHNVEGFARRRPGLFLGGAFLLSFALVRYLGRPTIDHVDDPNGDDITAAI